MKILTSEDMEQLGSSLAVASEAGTCIYLQGDLGAGKTTFVRGFLRGLGFHDKVKSPTYTLVEPYQLAERSIYHFDLYRIAEPLELEAIGIRDYLDGRGICLVEWPERAEGLLKRPDILVDISILDDGREVVLQPCTEKGKRILGEMVETL